MVKYFNLRSLISSNLQKVELTRQTYIINGAPGVGFEPTRAKPIGFPPWVSRPTPYHSATPAQG